MSPKQIHATLLPEIQEMVLRLTDGPPIAKLGEDFENFSSYFQALAIAHLLLGADLEQFKLYLTRSGYARRYFLRRSAEQGDSDNARLALGRTEAFLDAVAAGQMPLAREIAHLSGVTWRADWEYEDDFCYFLFLHTIADGLDPADEPQLREILSRFEKALEGGKSHRLTVCRAILGRESEAFHEALNALLEQRRAELFHMRERMQEPDPASCVCWARSFVSIEGFALMRLAEFAGLPPLEPEAEPPLCPAQGRIQAVGTAYEDFFVGIERRLAMGQ
jgi:Immunity protein 49